jgi:hypothetical protein
MPTVLRATMARTQWLNEGCGNHNRTGARFSAAKGG